MTALSVGTAWEETSAFLARESRLVVPVALALLAVPVAIQGWLSPAGTEGGGAPLIGLLLLVVAMAGQMAITQLAMGWTGSVGEVLARASRRLWPVIGAFLLAYFPLTMMASILIVASVGMEQLSALPTLAIDELARFPGLAMTILAVVAIAFFLSVRLLPLIAAGMAKDVGPTALIKQAWTLTSGHFGKLVAVVFLMAVASVLLSGAVTVVVGAAAVLLAGPATPGSLSALILGLANGIVSALVTTVYAALVGRIYVQLAAGEMRPA